jgi:hypothetical protein
MISKNKSASALVSPDKAFLRASALRKVNQALRDRHKTNTFGNPDFESVWLMTRGAGCLRWIQITNSTYPQ